MIDREDMIIFYNQINTVHRILVVALECLEDGNTADKYHQAAEIYGLANALTKSWSNIADKTKVRRMYENCIQEEINSMLQNFITDSLKLRQNIQARALVSKRQGFSNALDNLHRRPVGCNNEKTWTHEKTLILNDFFRDIVRFCLDVLEISEQEQQTDLAIVSLGSIATGMATGYSDIEYLILLSRERAQLNRAKLTGLADLVELLVICLGETPIHTAYKILEKEFQKAPVMKFEDLTKALNIGFRVDTAKRPQVRNYTIELIGYAASFLGDEAKQLFQPGNHTASSLLSPKFVLGSTTLFKKLQQGIEKNLRRGYYLQFLHYLWNHDYAAFKYNVVEELKNQQQAFEKYMDYQRRWTTSTSQSESQGISGISSYILNNPIKAAWSAGLHPVDSAAKLAAAAKVSLQHARDKMLLTPTALGKDEQPLAELQTNSGDMKSAPSWSPKTLLLYPLCLLRNTYWSFMHNAELKLPFTSNTWTMLYKLKEILQTNPSLLDNSEALISSWEHLLKYGLMLRLETEVEEKTSEISVSYDTLRNKHCELLECIFKFANQLEALDKCCKTMREASHPYRYKQHDQGTALPVDSLLSTAASASPSCSESQSNKLAPPSFKKPDMLFFGTENAEMTEKIDGCENKSSQSHLVKRRHSF